MPSPPSATLAQDEPLWNHFPDGLVLLAPDGTLMGMNPAALALHAFADLDDARARLAEIHTRFAFRSENGRNLPLAQTPVGRVLSGETFASQEINVVQHDLQRSWWGSFAGTVLPPASPDAPALRLLCVRDITLEKQAQLATLNNLRRDVQIYEIGQKLREAKSSAVIRQIAVQILGQRLRADRCYFVTYHAQNDMANLGPDWKKSGETAPASRLYPFRANPLNRDAAYLNGQTQVVPDVLLHPSVVASPHEMPNPPNVRAVLRVPLTPGTLDAALTVVMLREARHWTSEEIALAEGIAAQTRLVLDAAFVRERDHRIATHLQEALLPTVPAALPGLDLGSVYRAALDEAAIGGDFYDVFASAPGKTVLVIGDVSGKGLAAAAQVSAVRNMLRATVGVSATLAEAVTLLNRLLIGQHLLQNFATLFACVHDRKKQTLSWVSCGHEPAFLHTPRSAALTSLDATGIPLGIDRATIYYERTVSFAPGDSLLLYTDGFTEAGPSRTAMLQTEGVSRLLLHTLASHSTTAPNSQNQAAAIVRTLLAEAADFAHGVLHDDVCLLLAQATP